MLPRSRTALLAVTLALSSCRAPHEVPAPLVTTGPAFTADEIRRTVNELLSTTSSGIDALQRTELRERLDAFLSGEAFAAATRRTPVKAVGLYRFGEGGVVVKIARGEGDLRFVADPKTHHFRLKYTSIGAQVGGSISRGVLLALGAPTVSALEGTYVGEIRSATALDRTTGAPSFVHRTSGHRLCFIGVATGLSANVGESELVLAFDPPL